MAEQVALDRSTCLDFYRRLAAGVAVVTTMGREGPVGCTVSTVTSVSLDPPLILVSLTTRSSTLAALNENGRFCVHLLPEDRSGDAVMFARRGWPPRAGPLRPAQDFQDVLGVPVLDAALAWTVCSVEDTRRYGDHVLVIGQMVEVVVGTGRPLLWHGGRYWGLGRGTS